MVFTSNDKLHTRVVPLFLREDQVFVEGSKLKEDLKKLDAHYSKLPEEVKELGIVKFAQYPPLEDTFLVTRLWNRFLPRWRRNLTEPLRMSKETEQRLIEHLNALEESAQIDSSSKPIDIQAADHVIIKRRVPVRKGKWRLLPREVEESGGSAKRD